MDQKKASDLLGELKQSVDSLSKQMLSIDFNMKLILQKMGAAQTIAAQPQQQAPRVVATEAPPIARAVATGPAGGPQSSSAPNQAGPAPPPVQFPTANVHSGTVQEGAGQVVVQQLVLCGEDKPVRLARVDILDSTRQHLKKIYTSHVGKWTTRLNSGQYIVKLSKGTKEVEYTVTVTGSDPIMELPPRLLG